MVIERKDKLKNKAKIVKAVLNNPLDTQEKIAKTAWVNKSTVSRQLNEMQQTATKDDRIIWLTDKDFEIMLKIQAEKFRRLEEEKEQLNNNDIDKWDNSAAKRYTLFRWSATDEKGWLKNTVKWMTDDELMKYVD